MVFFTVLPAGLYTKKKKAAMMDSPSKGFKKILKILVRFRDLQEEFQLR